MKMHVKIERRHTNTLECAKVCPRGFEQTIDRRCPISTVITYPFHLALQEITTDMMSVLPLILNNVLSCERRFRSMPPEELRKLLKLSDTMA